MSIKTLPVKFESFVKTDLKDIVGAKVQVARNDCGGEGDAPDRKAGGRRLTKNQVLAEQYRSTRGLGEEPQRKEDSHSELSTLQSLHLIQRNNQLEQEVVTLRRLLEAKKASPNKYVDPYFSEDVDLLQLDELASDSNDASNNDVPSLSNNNHDVSIFRDNDLVLKEELGSSLRNRANDLVMDVEKLKRDLLSMGERGEAGMNLPLNDVTEGGAAPSRSAVSPASSVDNFFKPAPTSWEAERAALKNTIEQLQRQLAMKNVTIATLESKLKKKKSADGREIENDRAGQVAGKKGRGGGVIVGVRKGGGGKSRRALTDAVNRLP